MIKNILSPLQLELIDASNGTDGLQIMAEVRPSIVIGKFRSVPLDGLGLCAEMNRSPSLRGIPLILMGSSEPEEDIQKALDAGVLMYIDKKDAKLHLYSTVEQLVSTTGKHSSGIKILVVDDSISMRMMLEEGLSNEGYQVIVAEHGKKAIELIQTIRPDLILSDVYMPEMDGLELCQILHESSEFSSIPFVVMSTENDVENMKQMMQMGAAAFIIKPFNLEQLMITLNTIFSYEFIILLKEKERLEAEQRLLIAGITSLVNALEARDPYTRGHSERVSQILSGLVQFSGGSAHDIERARIAGRLHDIGKIGIRDDVLLKPGRLTAAEFDHIKKHPAIGSSILKTIPSISDIIPVVFSHHERIDGGGYPEGLHGSDIPLWARMTAVADTFDALTSNRPYRIGMPYDKAFGIIREASGTQLCSECVKLFFDWFDVEKPDLSSS
jgi:response regulator RpfG family c-di-GMP phosphodiesterase